MRGTIALRPYSANSSFAGGTSGKDRWVYRVSINGVTRWDYLYRIIAMYAVGELFSQGPLFDLREVHHIDGDVNNCKPDNLQIAENRRQHKILDLYTRAQRLWPNKFRPIRLKGTVCIGDIIRDDFDVEIAIDWWIEQYENSQNPSSKP